jgi:BlaI family penicillinase repressor
MKVTDAESKILRILWKANRPMPADEVVIRLGKGPEWSAGTVRTFLARLVKKRVVAAQKDGRRYLYRPLITHADYAHQESRKLIDRLFNGRIAPFLTQFSERHDLGRTEIAELKRIIERLDHGR